MAYVFEMPFYVSFLAFCLLGIFFYLCGYVALRIFSRQAALDEKSLPIGAFIGTIATAWALALGFVAADIWSVNSKADQATTAERSAITRLLGITAKNVLNAPVLQSKIIEYRKAVANNEWSENANAEPAATVETALQGIRQELVKLARTDVPAANMSQLIRDFDKLQDARNARLAVGSTSVDAYKWYLVLFLTLLTSITIAATHADRRSAAAKALALYATTAAVSLWILAVHANPYQGLEQLEPSLLFTNTHGNQSESDF